MKWQGVMPAITTPFREDLSVDHEFLAEHCRWLVDHGSTGIVALGSLGEAATLEEEEKLAILDTCVAAAGGRVPVVAGIASLATAQAVRLARAAADRGCRGLMVLPPWVYRSDWRETRAHLDAVFRATGLSCMLYNNPVAYGTDCLPLQMRELAAEHSNLHAVKESSADVRRVTGIREVLGDRLAIFMGVDDAIVEGVKAGAVGWIAGLVNALPAESIALFETGDDELYRWFLPLLRLDVVVKFVQLIKLVQEEVGKGSSRVRPPRLPLAGAELEEALALIRGSLSARPAR